jgi:hypothetical protein
VAQASGIAPKFFRHPERWSISALARLCVGGSRTSVPAKTHAEEHQYQETPIRRSVRISFASRRVASHTTSQRFKAFAIDTAPQAADDAHPVN